MGLHGLRFDRAEIVDPKVKPIEGPAAHGDAGRVVQRPGRGREALSEVAGPRLAHEAVGELAGEDLAHQLGHIARQDTLAFVEDAARRLEELGDVLLGQAARPPCCRCSGEGRWP